MTLKLLVLLCLLMGMGVESWPQGQLVFNNRVLNAVVAPIYDVEPSDPALAKHGNTTTGTPPGTQTYSGPPLAGPGFTAQLFAGRTNTAPEHLRPLLPRAVFRTGEGAGFIVAPGSALSVPGVGPGELARVQMRVWDNREGTITNWLQVLADPVVPRGTSLSWVTTEPLGGLFLPPPNLIGLESFNLATGAAQQPSFRINFQPAECAVPAEYMPDIGLAYGDRGPGLVYGWNLDHTTSARCQNAAHSPDPRFDSFIFMDQSSGSSWEIAAASGLYHVYVVAGDPLSLEGVYRIEVEGVSVLSGSPVPGNPWVDGAVVVEVTDGRLTVRSGAGSVSNRICFIDIAPLAPPRFHTPRQADFDLEGLRLRFTAVSGIQYQLQASTNLLTWWTLGTATDSGNDQFEFLDKLVLDAPHRFYRAQARP